MDLQKELSAAGGLVLIGAAIGVGQLLASKEPMSTRLIAGRALVSGGLGLAAAAILAWMPALDFYTQMGVAAAFASLGTSAIEMLVKKFTGAS
jgi:hypothetical protein